MCGAEAGVDCGIHAAVCELLQQPVALRQFWFFCLFVRGDSIKQANVAIFSQHDASAYL